MSFRTDPPSLPIGPHPIVNPHHRTHVLLQVAAGGFGAALSVLVLIFLYCRLPRRRTAPLDSKPPHRLPYALLRRATASFAAHNLLGRGGFGPVYKGVAVHPILDGDIAVKVMDAGSLQGEREFQNELLFAQRLNQSAVNVAPAIGFSTSQRRRRRRLCLVYDLMRNGNLQDALLRRKCAELMEWRNRFCIAVDIAKGIEHLHHSFNPPIIHGDIKPSNILLDHNFAAKIGDFGLARLKSEEVAVAVDVTAAVEMTGGGLEEVKKVEGSVEDSGSVAEEAESVITVVEEFNYGVTPSPEPDILGKVEATVSPEAVERAGASSPEIIEVVVEDLASSPSTVVSEGTFDKGSVDSGGNRSCREKNKSIVSRRQDNMNGDSGDRQVKEYVMDWIGTEVRKERPKSSWIATSSDSAGAVTIRQPEQKRFELWKKNGRRLEWWASLDDEKNVKKENRRPREWWKEEFCEELARKKKKKQKKVQHEMGVSNECNEDSCWPKDEELYVERRRKKSSRNSKSSVDWWLDGGKHCSYDSVSGEIPKSGGISSTPSMRGTVCYIAPEYGGGGGGGYVSEKCDVYSYGVLLLVLVAGRRPLEVTGSPMSEFQRANLISWARHLARSGKLHELVDQCIVSLNQEQALLCTTVALLCLQKQPARRPSMKQVVGMLCGELGRPQLPVEFSPSPPSRVSFKSRKKRFS